MAYVHGNPKTKKALIDAVKAGKQLTAFNPGLGQELSNFTGRVALEGPHYPEPHKWYAQAEIVNGIIVKVK